MPPYSDFFSLKEAWYAVTSKISIEDPNNHWQDTYPHATFVDMLKKAVKMLSRPEGNSNAAKPLWVHGSYGTGKSRIVWTLRELLNCPPEELNAYFDEYAELKYEKELREKLLGLKNGGKIVVAMRYESGGVNGLDGLVMAIYTSVCEALEARSLNSLAHASLSGAILRWLDDPVNHNILTQILTAEPYCHNGNLPKSGQEARAALLSGGHENLIEELMRIGRDRHILGLSFDVNSLCDWLREVIEINDLKALVFIFDEFSDFLSANRNIYSSIQELAHLSQRVPFYFIIVTHFTQSLFRDNDPAAKVMMDRFNRHEILLPDYTAFKLLGHALRVKEEKTEEWKEYQEDLNDRLEEARRGVSKIVPALERDDFKKILPIHPFAALILKNVASIFDSNQRSMFNFIAVDQEEVQAFQYFIHNYGPDEPSILSVDQLWHYFYESGKGGGGLGLQNLRTQAREILSAYPQLEKCVRSREAEADMAERKLRALKTVVILQALRAVAPDSKFFDARKEILEIAFNGISDLDYGQGISLLDALVNEKALFMDSEIYQIPMGHAVDQAEILKNVEVVRQNTATAALITNFNPWEILPANKALETRLVIRKAGTGADFTKALNSLIAQERMPWQIKILMVFASAKEEISQLQEQMAKALADQRASNIYFIDASFTPMQEEKFEEMILARGRQRYFAGKNEQQAGREGAIADNALRGWQNEIGRGKFALYSSKDPEGKICHTGDELVDRLKGIVLAQYPACCDFAPGVVDTHFRPGANINAVKAGLGLEVTQPQVSRQQADKILAKVRMEKYWDAAPDEPLSILRNDLEKMARRAFASTGAGQLSIKKIIDDFVEKGLMPTVLACYLTGFLLRDFAGPEYRYSDGNTGDVMAPERLAEMIRDYYQKLTNPGVNYREQFIEVLTKEQRAFADLSQKIFNLESGKSLDAIAINISEIVKNWGYPLWALREMAEADGLEDYVANYGALLNPQACGMSGPGQVASAIGKMILKDKEAEEKLKVLFRQENLEKGMKMWLEGWQEGELSDLAQEIHVEDVLRDVRSCFSGDRAWLWDRETGEEALKGLLQGYRLCAESIRRGFLTHAASKSQCLEGWRQKLMQLRMPVEALQERYPDQKQILAIFKDLAKNGVLAQSRENKLYESITRDAERLREIFDNSRDTFKAAYAAMLDGLAEEEKNTLYNKLPGSAFYEDRNTYENELKPRVEELASKLKRNELGQIWQAATGRATPRELSKALRTPLKIMLAEIFGEGGFKAALGACEAVNNSNAPESEIANAIFFWQGHQGELARLADQGEADRAFEKGIIGDYKNVLGDVEKAREALANKYGPDAWGWLDNPGWQKVVKELAKREFGGNREAVARKINGMTLEQARKKLQELAENDLDVAMRIMEV